MLLARSKPFIPVDLTRRVFAKASRTTATSTDETAMVARGDGPQGTRS